MFRTLRLRCMLVLRHGRLVGIITKRDLLQNVEKVCNTNAVHFFHKQLITAHFIHRRLQEVVEGGLTPCATQFECLAKSMWLVLKSCEYSCRYAYLSIYIQVVKNVVRLRLFMYTTAPGCIKALRTTPSSPHSAQQFVIRVHNQCKTNTFAFSNLWSYIADTSTIIIVNSYKHVHATQVDNP